MRVATREGALRALHTRTLFRRRCWTIQLTMQKQIGLVSAVRQSRGRASACRWSQIRVSIFLLRRPLDARPEPTRSTICSPPSCKHILWLRPACQIRLPSLTTTTPLLLRPTTTASLFSTSPLHAKTRTTRVALPFPSTNWALPCTIVHWVLSQLPAPLLAPRLTVRRPLFLTLPHRDFPLSFLCAFRIQNIQDPLIQSFVIVPVLHPSKKSNSAILIQTFLPSSYLTVLKPLPNSTPLPCRCHPLSTASTRPPPQP